MIKEINGRWTCTECGYEYSGMMSDGEVSDKCECEIEDSMIDKHSVNCYFCGKLVDERDCIPADDYNENDGGSICPECMKMPLPKKIV